MDNQPTTMTTTTTPPGDKEAGQETYPASERAFEVVRCGTDVEGVYEFRTRDRATLSSYPAKDREDAQAMAFSLNQVVVWHAACAVKLAQDSYRTELEQAQAEVARLKVERDRLREALRKLNVVATDCAAVLTFYGVKSIPLNHALEKTNALLAETGEKGGE